MLNWREIPEWTGTFERLARLKEQASVKSGATQEYSSLLFLSGVGEEGQGC